MKDLLQTNKPSAGGSVECLGMTFPSEDARREHFLKLLAEKLKDPDFRNQEGFPQGTDEAILALSDPPYYTACPNPFLSDVFAAKRAQNRNNVPAHTEPFAADVSEGKNESVYLAHSYHTKVPHKAVMRYILHYTKPGDVILDGFCGTGMTGVASHLCNNEKAIRSLGYIVDSSGTIFEPASEGSTRKGKAISSVGQRFTILGDLSPAATFIAAGYNSSIAPDDFEEKADEALKIVQETIGWMFLTLHNPSEPSLERAIGFINKNETPNISNIGDCGRINYTLWSDVFSCPECAGEFVFWDAAVDRSTNQVLDDFLCPHCSAGLGRKNIEPVWSHDIDPVLGHSSRRVKQVPALISYIFGGKRYEKRPDRVDHALLRKIDELDPDITLPVYPMMFKGENWGDSWRAGYHAGVTHIHHFYGRRNFIGLAAYKKHSRHTLYAPNLTSTALVASKLYRFRSQGGSLGAGGGPMSGTLYLPSLVKEIPILKLLKEHIKKTRQMRYALGQVKNSFITTGSMSQLPIPDSSVDYVFLDPPFGSNLMYAELNFIWEAWLDVFTDTAAEAVQNKSQKKSISDYRHIMASCFREAFRVLKPGCWMTVEFSNTQASVWNAIQIALQEAGFVVANVSALDKKQGSFKAVNTTTAVKQDLVISAYKPNGGLEERFIVRGGTEESVWDFVRTHLSYLPIAKMKNGELEYVVERDPRILFDRLVAWFVRHNVPVPLSTQEFQEGLSQRFSVRDGMVMLEEQAVEYDKKRAGISQAPQLELFVSDERSAIDWLTDFLRRRPSTYQEINPEFMTQLGAGWKKHEIRPELSSLLEDNFLRYDGSWEVPSQIHSYLSSNFKDLRGLEKDDPRLKAKAKDRWYVPDPSKAKDLEQKRERSLLKEFEAYKTAQGRRLREFRLEVLRAGFKTAWAARDYKTIIGIAQKIPEDALQEDEKLLLWYDQALTRMEADA